MTAEEIVRALAGSDPVEDLAGGRCVLCHAILPFATADHDEGCPWRMAVEWVEGCRTRRR